MTDTLKTKSSSRTLPLVPVIEAELLGFRKRIEDNQRFYGNIYNKKYLEYVFVDESGGIIYPDNYTKKFHNFLKDNGLEHIRLHDLRHSVASLLLANGIQIKQIQEWLGHSNFATTADIYSHLDFSSKVQSANTISGVLDISGKKEEKKSIPAKDTANAINMLAIQNIRREMEELGIEDFNDYLCFKELSDTSK